MFLILMKTYKDIKISNQEVFKNSRNISNSIIKNYKKDSYFNDIKYFIN